MRAPEAVIAVHTAFIAAGAELIEANTFGANRRKFSGLLLDDQLEEIVETGVKLAREAREISGRAVFVAGSIGPLGELDGTHGGEDAYESSSSRPGSSRAAASTCSWSRRSSIWRSSRPRWPRCGRHRRCRSSRS